MMMDDDDGEVFLLLFAKQIDLFYWPLGLKRICRIVSAARTARHGYRHDQRISGPGCIRVRKCPGYGGRRVAGHSTNDGGHGWGTLRSAPGHNPKPSRGSRSAVPGGLADDGPLRIRHA